MSGLFICAKYSGSGFVSISAFCQPLMNEKFLKVMRVKIGMQFLYISYTFSLIYYACILNQGLMHMYFLYFLQHATHYTVS